MKNIALRLTICIVFLLTTMAGCGGGSDHPPTVRAGGTVTLNGQPVAGATIAFSGDGHAALAISGDDGRFQLTTFEEGDGAVEGDYQVTVVKMLGGDAPSDAGGDSMEAAVTASEKRQKSNSPQSVLPKRYGDPNTSGLQFTIKKGEDNDFELQFSP